MAERECERECESSKLAKFHRKSTVRIKSMEDQVNHGGRARRIKKARGAASEPNNVGNCGIPQQSASRYVSPLKAPVQTLSSPDRTAGRCGLIGGGDNYSPPLSPLKRWDAPLDSPRSPRSPGANGGLIAG